MQQLRQKNTPIRKIVQEPGVTKYAVETALKEMDAENPNKVVRTVVIDFFSDDEPDDQTAQTDAQTLKEGAQTRTDIDQTLQLEGQTLQNHHQTGLQTPFLELSVQPDTVKRAQEEGILAQKIQQKAGEKGKKEAETVFFPPIDGFLPPYRRLLQELQRCIHQQRSVWTHIVRDKYLVQLENLRKQAQSHCREHGIGYEDLLVSEVLEACGRYLRDVLRTAPVIKTLIGLSYVRLPLDVDLVSLCRRAQQADFCLVEQAHRSAA